MMSQIEEVRERWSSFLKKIRDRHQQVLEDAKPACIQLLDFNEYDTIPMTNAWTGVSGQLLQVRSKIDDTWEQKVESAFEEAYDNEDSDDDYFDEFKPAENLINELELDQRTFEVQIFGHAAELLLEQAKTELARDFRCTQCSANLKVEYNVFRSYFVPCDYCNTINTFDPGTKIRQVEYFCADNLARNQALEEERTMIQLDSALRQSTDPSLEELKAYQLAAKTYWTKYFEERGKIVPAYLIDLHKDIEAKLRVVTQELNSYDNYKPENGQNKFNQQFIADYIRTMGKALAMAGEFPEQVYAANWHKLFDEDRIKSWLSDLWDEELESQVHAFFNDDLDMYRRLMPAPKTLFYDSFIDEIKRTNKVYKIRSRT